MKLVTPILVLRLMRASLITAFIIEQTFLRESVKILLNPKYLIMKNLNFEIRVFHRCGYTGVEPHFRLYIDKEGIVKSCPEGNVIDNDSAESVAFLREIQEGDHLDVLLEGTYRDEPTKHQRMRLKELFIHEMAGSENVRVNLYIQDRGVSPLTL